MPSKEIAPKIPLKVSIILPTYNRRAFIGQAIESVLAQSFQNFELIIVDDGSTDGTTDFVKPFLSDRVQYIYQENAGRSCARNTAINIAKGEYIAFLDSDDLYLPEKLELQVKYLDENPGVGMIYTSAYCIDADGRSIDFTYEANKSGNIYKEVAFFKPVTITLPTVMVRRQVLHVVGKFDEAMSRFEDTDMWRRIAKLYEVHAIPTATCKLRTHQENSILGQNLSEIYEAISFYLRKVFIEDRDVDISTLRAGAAQLCFFYSKALLSSPNGIFLGSRLMVKSIMFKPINACRIILIPYYIFLSHVRKIKMARFS